MARQPALGLTDGSPPLILSGSGFLPEPRWAKDAESLGLMHEAQVLIVPQMESTER